MATSLSGQTCLVTGGAGFGGSHLTEQLLARGYPPYRLNVSSMHHVGGDDVYADVLRKLKGALDPNGILAPGRYQPSSAGPGLPAASTLTATS